MNLETSTLDSARRHLQAARKALDLEIRSYPAPIAGCDAQFNHLLAERRRADGALRRWMSRCISRRRARLETMRVLRIRQCKTMSISALHNPPMHRR